MSKDKVPIFEVTVCYKSGNRMVFRAKEFSVKGTEYSWTALEGNLRPLQIGVDDIESVWYREEAF
jgi:hypothetical protein